MTTTEPQLQPVELQWSHCSNDLAWLSTQGDCVWPHSPLLPPGDMSCPGRDLTSSQSDKLWWVFQSKHNWSSLLTSNLYSARVHLTRHCRAHLASARSSRTFLESSGPFHYLRQQTESQVLPPVSPHIQAVWRTTEPSVSNLKNSWDPLLLYVLIVSILCIKIIIHFILVWQNCCLLVGGVGCSWSGTRGAESVNLSLTATSKSEFL